MDIQQRDGMLTFFIPALIVEKSIGRNAYRRPYKRNLPIFAVVDLPKTGEKGRIQGRPAWAVYGWLTVNRIRFPVLFCTVLHVLYTDRIVLGRTDEVQGHPNQ